MGVVEGEGEEGKGGWWVVEEGEWWVVEEGGWWNVLGGGLLE